MPSLNLLLSVFKVFHIQIMYQIINEMRRQGKMSYMAFRLSNGTQNIFIFRPPVQMQSSEAVAKRCYPSKGYSQFLSKQVLVQFSVDKYPSIKNHQPEAH